MVNRDNDITFGIDSFDDWFCNDDVDACWGDYPKERLIDILNDDYSVDDAKDDLRSLIGTKYDTRQNGL